MNELIWQQVNDIYVQELGRNADPGGHQNFYNELASGRMSIDEVRNAMRGSPEYQQKNQNAAPPAPAPAPQNQFITTNNESGAGYYTQGEPTPVDSNTGQIGTFVTTNADQGGQFVPLTLSTPTGQFVTTNQESGAGYFNEYSPEQAAAAAAAIESGRQDDLQRASQYLAANPLPISGDQIATQYGNRNISSFRPILQPGQTATGSTPTQLVDPQSNLPVYLSNPNDPYSYTYENTGTPAIGGTLEQQAAMFRPVENKGVFGTLGGDILSSLKDPMFKNFALAAASMAAAAALAPALGASGAGSAASTGATAFPIDFGSTVMSGGLTGGGATAVGGTLGAGSSTAGGFLGGAGDILAGAAGTGGGSLGALAPAASGGLGGLFASGSELMAGPYGSLIKGGLTLGGLAAANALKPKVDTSTGTSGLSSADLQAIVAGMPSMVGQYTSQAGTGQPIGGYNPNMSQSLANLFPGFNLPTQGPFYGAGRFGDNYAPVPATSLV